MRSGHHPLKHSELLEIYDRLSDNGKIKPAEAFNLDTLFDEIDHAEKMALLREDTSGSGVFFWEKKRALKWAIGEVLQKIEEERKQSSESNGP